MCAGRQQSVEILVDRVVYGRAAYPQEVWGAWV